MSEDVKSNADPAAEPEKEPEAPEKTFTQSDFDRIMAKKIKEIESKYSDYSETKLKYEELEKLQKEKELAEKSELEKREIKIQELSSKLEDSETKLSNQTKINLRNEILSLGKYSSLPRVYKNSVSLSESKEEIIASADEVLKEWEKDRGKSPDTFGAPMPQNGKAAAPPLSAAQRVQEKIKANYLKFKPGD